MKQLLVLLIAFTSVAVSASTNSELFVTTCGELNLSTEVKYCVHAPKEGTSQDILYYLHPVTGSERKWEDEWYYTRQLREEWLRTKARVPTVVSVSFGSVWLLAGKNSSRQSGLLDVFTDEVIPTIESNIGGLKGERIVLGESMGGFNAAQLALRSGLFDKAAVLCPLVYEISPFASSSEVDDFVKRSGAWNYHKNLDRFLVPLSVRGVFELFARYYPTQNEWDAADPLKLADKAEPQRTPQVYLTAGFYDRYALYEGSERLAEKLKERGLSVEWVSQWGGHCAFEIKSLAAFLASPPGR